MAQLSEWLQLMTAEIARKQDESHHARVEQQKRGVATAQSSSAHPAAAPVSSPARQSGG